MAKNIIDLDMTLTQKTIILKLAEKDGVKITNNQDLVNYAIKKLTKGK